jgi:hypothetical protein
LRVLILTAWYHPLIHPRAHRWTSLAEHWAAQGHEVHVLCALRRDCPDESVLNGVRVHRAGFDSLKEVVYFWSAMDTGRGRVGAGVRKPGCLERVAFRLYQTIWKNLYFPDDACLWYFPARRKLRSLLKSVSFDAVVSVSLPFTGHLLGWAAKRQKPELHWLVDIGDPFTIQPKPLNNALLYGRLSRRLERQMLENADAVVVTNAGAVQAYREQFGEVAGKMQVAPPLWRPQPLPKMSEGPAIENGKNCGSGCQIALSWNQPITRELPPPPVRAGLEVGYFGALYAPTRTPNAFLDLLKKTHATRPELYKRLTIHFFGEVFPEFYEALSRTPGIQMHGLRSRAETQDAMQQMDFLLHIGNTTTYQLPSKVVDYLAAGKPVVHLSYVERDPFVEFWGDVPGLLVLLVRDGRVTEMDMLRWLDFLTKKHPEPSETERLGRVRKFTVPAVAAAYEKLIFVK